MQPWHLQTRGGIQANEDRIAKIMRESLMLVTALALKLAMTMPPQLPNRPQKRHNPKRRSRRFGFRHPRTI